MPVYSFFTVQMLKRPDYVNVHFYDLPDFTITTIITIRLMQECIYPSGINWLRLKQYDEGVEHGDEDIYLLSI